MTAGIELFAIAATVGVYAASRALSKRAAWAHPLLVTCAALIALLRLFHIRGADYQRGAHWITYLLGPATVALGVPMYKHARRLKAALGSIFLSVSAGAAVGMITAGMTAAWLGASRQLVMSALPKSVTTPIAIEVAAQLHGLPELTAGMAIVAGLLGSIIGVPLLRSTRISHDVAVGAAIGTASHAIGTARLVADSELQASAASLSMALAGIVTSILAVPVPWLFQ